MARPIVEIEKAIADKQKMVEKNKSEAPKVEKEITTFAESKVDLDDKIKKEKNGKKKAEMEKERELVIGKHTAAKLKLATIEKAETGIVESLEKLEAELKAAKDGVEQYGKVRREGIAMLEREGRKLKAAHDKAKDGMESAEECSRLAEACAKKGDENGALGAKNSANNAVMKTIEGQREAEGLIIGIRTAMTKSQRNLKARDFDVADKDVQVHAGLTKKVQDDFKMLEMMARLTPSYVEHAERAAEEARDFADSSAVGIEMYDKMLDKALRDGQVKIKQIQGVLASKWGSYITKKGELFTRILLEVQQKPTDQGIRAGADKAVEQGQTYLGATKGNVDGMIEALQLSCKKSVERVAPEYRTVLKQKMDKVNLLSMQMISFGKKVQGDYDLAVVEFEKLSKALS